jgi:hypothetical protein
LVLPNQITYRIRGRVVDSVSGLSPRSASISITRRETSTPSIGTIGKTSYNGAIGTFEIRDVVPGSYWVRVQATESTTTAIVPATAVGRPVSEVLSTGATATRTAAQVPVEVSGDIDGVVLNLSPGISISGMLRVEGQALPTSLVPRVSLRTDTTGVSSPSQAVNADGSFTLQNVFPGEYRVFVTPLGPDLYVKQATIDQNDLLNKPWVITGAVRGSLEVVVSGKAGQVDGVVLDNRVLPVGGIQAVLVPDESRDRVELFKTGVTDQAGRFNLRGITPGRYHLFAWENIEPNAYFDPEILRQYEQQGKPIQVNEGGKITTEVRMIPGK